MTSKEKAAAIQFHAEEVKAEQIETLDVRKKTPIADFFVVCTGNSDVHVNAIVDRVEKHLAEVGVQPLRRETQGGGWLLLDFGDVVFHVMREEKRQFYDLETLWKTINPNPDLMEPSS